MSIQALQLRIAERPAERASGYSFPAAPASAGSAAAGAESNRSPDLVEVSSQGRRMADALSQAQVELQLSPARLRELMAAKLDSK